MSLAFASLFTILSVFNPSVAVGVPVDQLFFEQEAPKAAPVVDCEGKAKCTVQFALNEEVSDASVKDAIAWLDAAEAVKATHFVLEIDTYGGSVDAGIDLIKRIEKAEIPITCIVDTKAYSMGAAILQSCPERLMTKRAALMFHEPSLGALFQGTPNEWEAIAEHMKALRTSLAYMCNARLSTSIKEYRRRTDGGKQWWMTFEDALKFKAVDGVVASVPTYIKKL